MKSAVKCSLLAMTWLLCMLSSLCYPHRIELVQILAQMWAALSSPHPQMEKLTNSWFPMLQWTAPLETLNSSSDCKVLMSLL